MHWFPLTFDWFIVLFAFEVSDWPDCDAWSVMYGLIGQFRAGLLRTYWGKSLCPANVLSSENGRYSEAFTRYTFRGDSNFVFS